MLAGIGIFYHFICTILNLKEPAITWLNNSLANSLEGLLLGALVMLLYFLISGILAGGKMAMGDGDIYIAAALGACLGFEKAIYMLILAFVLQILITFVTFEYSLFKSKDFKIFTSIILFVIMGVGYYFLDKYGVFNQNTAILLIYTMLWILVSLFILKDTFTRVWNLKEKSADAVLENFVCIPFGPALCAGALLSIFFLNEVSLFFKNIM